MRKFLSLLLSAALALSLCLTAFAADGSTIPAAHDPSSAVEGVVTELTVGGSTVYVYAPESELTVSSTCTAPCFVVFGDGAYTAETAEAEALSSGLAALAAAEGATVVFVNPQGDEWAEADIGVYMTLAGMYSNSSDSIFVGGISNSVNVFTGQEETKIQGEVQRIYVYAEGAGADFVAANYIRSFVTTMTFPDGNSMLTDSTAASITLFNPTALPEAAEPTDIVIAVVNGPEDAAEKLAGLTDKCLADTSDVTDGFDAEWIAENYGSFTGAYRRQYGVRLPMHDYAAEGIVESVEHYTLSSGVTVGYVVYYGSELAVADSANPVPLMMVFHGGGNTAFYHAQASEWPQVGKANGFITVAVDNHVSLDAAQTVELLKHVQSGYAIDASRIYASGFSMGSVKSWSLFEEYPELFAGLAPMSGSFASPEGDPSGVITPVFYVGGEASILAELCNQGPDIIKRIGYVLKANSVSDSYAYDADTNLYWGVNGDVVYQVTDNVAFLDSTLTVNLFRSADGKFYTALASSGNQNHEVYARNSWAAWDFLSQFSRNADGSISIAPVTYTLASDDGKITGNSYNTFESSYSDVYGTTPYAEAIETVTKAGLINGMGNGKFAPDVVVTRAQAVTMAYRLAGAKVNAASPFVDVAESAWYYDSVVWACSSGIVKVDGGDRFAPDDTITSEQLDLLLTRIAEDLGIEYTGSGAAASTVTRADLANRLVQFCTTQEG